LSAGWRRRAPHDAGTSLFPPELLQCKKTLDGAETSADIPLVVHCTMIPKAPELEPHPCLKHVPPFSISTSPR
jgi:hypothetical protein